MGASGRPSDLNLTDFDSTVDFFAKSIHKYTEKAGLGQNGEKFYLLGHSLGGFIAAQYAIKHVEQIEKLILMSAIGVPERPASSRVENYYDPKHSFATRYAARWANDGWATWDVSPADLYRIIGYRATKA